MDARPLSPSKPLGMGLPGHRLLRHFFLPAFAVLCAALPVRADQGDLHLDVGAASLFQGSGRDPALAGTMGFRFGLDPHSELRLGVDYGRFFASSKPGPWELTGIGLASFFAPYPGRLQPLLGIHMGMTRVDHEWKPLVGLEAQALAAFHRSFLGYASVAPGAWVGDGDAEIWVKLGLGLRMRLGW